MVIQSNTPLPSDASGRRNSGLGHSLAPALRRVNADHLGPITWFRTDWQRSGASTGRAIWTSNDGTESEVVVKIPVSEREFRWLWWLQDTPAPSPVPRLYASGDTLEHYHLGWVIIEHLPFGPLGAHWHDDHLERITLAAAQFQAAASVHPVDRDLKHEDWEGLFKRSREAARGRDLTAVTRWRKALKTASKHLDQIVEQWHHRAPIGWIHGDLHLANGMSREAGEDSPVVLIDLAEVRPGHWVEDAVYLERLHWARPERLQGRNPVKLLAAARRRVGLEIGSDHPRLADIRRILLAACVPAFLRTEGVPTYVQAALGQLEDGLRRIH